MKGLSFSGKVIFVLNIILATLLFGSCIATYISVESFPLLFVFSLASPLLVLLNGLFVLYWLFCRIRYVWISVFVLLVGYFTQDSFVKLFNSNADINPEDISILTYNILEFEGGEGRNRNPLTAGSIIKFVSDEDPDIICFQEFDRRQLKRHGFDQYPYKYSNTKPRVYGSGVLQAIYSKYPIINSGELDFQESSNGAIFSDIVIDNDTIRVYNIHLQSLSVRAGSFKREQPQRLLKRLGAVFEKQQKQAILIKEHADKSKLKKIICGDFNNTQFSNVHRVIKGQLQDTFKEKGFGYGRTYDFKFLPFRIDFILVDKSLEVIAHKNFDVKYSDHYPVMASFRP